MVAVVVVVVVNMYKMSLHVSSSYFFLYFFFKNENVFTLERRQNGLCVYINARAFTGSKMPIIVH